jgi:hypothetical protein
VSNNNWVPGLIEQTVHLQVPVLLAATFEEMSMCKKVTSANTLPVRYVITVEGSFLKTLSFIVLKGWKCNISSMAPIAYLLILIGNYIQNFFETTQHSRVVDPD